MIGKERAKKYLIIILIILIFGCCYYFFNEIILNSDQPIESEVIFSNYGAYEYDPQTILENISSDNKKLFHEIDYDIGMNLPKGDLVVHYFSDEELYQISRSLLNYVSDDGIDEWKLVRIIYTYHDCEKKIISSSFVYERTLPQNGEKSVEIRGFEITTFSNIVEWTDKVEKRTSIRQIIDWEKIKYYPSNVFDIVKLNEGGGGQIDQMSNCGEIVLRLYGYNKNWSVNCYDNEDWMNIYNVEINSITGNVRR